MIPREELDRFKKYVDSSQRPLFLFDDDADGTCSFTLLDKYLGGEAFGVCVKGSPEVDASYLVRIPEFRADTVFILDKPMISEGFVQKAAVPIVWLDHHPVQDAYGTHYFNPKIHDDDSYSPTSKWVYEAVQDEKLLWIAMIGMVGDWYLEDTYKELFVKHHPSLLGMNVTSPEQALFESKLGTIVKILNFNLLGRVSDTMKSVKAFTEIKTPEEILAGKTRASQYLLETYEKVNAIYESVKRNVSVSEDSEFLVHRYSSESYSFTSELSNELLYEHPNKTILVARESNDRLIMSLRSKKKIDDSLMNALRPFRDADGGGHEHACGASVKIRDFSDFLRIFKEEVTS